ncbi:sterol desaturase family protein [Flavivirga algicola]|uniref:Sterol desaturase family protein n=1 Tax=Flavivirga algicola TaxID=2729136 RepID=A0ABX1S1E1_9FLAO|nr:sterol desaturase family protein [Flavivirga algicola]NMH88249.1 sterol desaturase family protein [Flavivirga algicola]
MSFAKLISLFEEAQIMTFIGYFFLFNLGIIILEILVDVFTLKKRRWKDTIANISIFIINQLLEKTIIGTIGVVCLVPVSWLSFFEIPLHIYTWILAFFVADFTYYWMHRLEHEHRILWASHSVHHSSEDYNLTISLRLSIVEGLFEWLFLIPMVLVGFSPFQAIVGLVLVAQFQTWIHTERIGKLGWLDGIFNTPSIHRVHHGSNNKYLDKNYGGFLIIWDRLFGTYQKEEEPVVYGLTKNINTNNPIKINFIEYKHILEDVKRCKTLKDKLRIVFGSLIWKP